MNTNAEIPISSVPGISNIGNLTGRIALITGASSGLGRAIATHYAAAGAYIVNADLTPNPPNAPIVAETLKGVDLKTPTADLINAEFPSKNNKPRCIFVTCNVTDPESMQAAVKATVDTYGRLDIMVNNAGISAETTAGAFGDANRDPRIHATDLSVLDKTYAVNIKGVWLGLKYACGQMLAQEPHPSGDRGWVINLCSICGLQGLAGASSYCASKGAVLLMTKTVALEYAKDKIHVNCINPGFVETNLLEPMKQRQGVEASNKMLESLHPWGRIGRPDDIAKMAVFLAGDGASWCTGQAFVVDGGYTAQ